MMKRRLKRYLPQLPGDILKIIVMVIFAFPFYWMVITSFKPYFETIQSPPTLWPHDFTLDNLKEIFTGANNILQYAFNSIVVTVSVVVIQALVMIPAAYAFATREFPLKKLMFGMVLIAFMIPEQITYISVYLMFSKAQMIDSLWPQILPFGANAFGIFMLRQSFKQVNGELFEAARMDNAGEWKIMMKVALPICRPTLIATMMLSVISIWNSYFWPLVMTNDDKFRPLTLYVEKLKQDVEQGLQWNMIMAGNMILVVPIIIIYCFGSKQIIKAFTYNGVK